ncbi:hypothetical protein BD289DRAFT_293183 [Coniella lustricola]|uniref:Uncharacterized protein n=1 Tax=Coniella lustricola TaxID=2025994 RepID=A0A2T3A4Z1_9PEZI|nr:hypothetical protein BD289DRAFT_293183 [Coniella lustricola]
MKKVAVKTRREKSIRGGRHARYLSHLDVIWKPGTTESQSLIGLINPDSRFVSARKHSRDGLVQLSLRPWVICFVMMLGRKSLALGRWKPTRGCGEWGPPWGPHNGNRATDISEQMKTCSAKPVVETVVVKMVALPRRACTVVAAAATHSSLVTGQSPWPAHKLFTSLRNKGSALVWHALWVRLCLVLESFLFVHSGNGKGGCACGWPI